MITPTHLFAPTTRQSLCMLRDYRWKIGRYEMDHQYIGHRLVSIFVLLREVTA